MTHEPLFYTVPQAAARLGIDADTAYVLIRGGHLTARRLHPKGHLRITAADLAAFVASRPVEPIERAEFEPQGKSKEIPAPKRDRRHVVRLLDVYAVPTADDGEIEAAR